MLILAEETIKIQLYSTTRQKLLRFPVYDLQRFFVITISDLRSFEFHLHTPLVHPFTATLYRCFDRFARGDFLLDETIRSGRSQSTNTVVILASVLAGPFCLCEMWRGRRTPKYTGHRPHSIRSCGEAPTYRSPLSEISQNFGTPRHVAEWAREKRVIYTDTTAPIIEP